MGRWSYLHLKPQHMPPVTVIVIYQVCQPPTSAIGSTPWHQQRRILDKEQRHQLYPRTAFQEDLSALFDPCIASTFNGCGRRLERSLRLSQFVNMTNMHVISIHFCPQQPNFPSHESGSHHIDCVLVSQDILQTIDAMGYSPISMMSMSDHRSLLLRFSIQKLFGSSSSTIPPSITWALRSNNRTSVTVFVESMHVHLEHNGA